MWKQHLLGYIYKVFTKKAVTSELDVLSFALLTLERMCSMFSCLDVLIVKDNLKRTPDSGKFLTTTKKSLHIVNYGYYEDIF